LGPENRSLAAISRRAKAHCDPILHRAISNLI